MYSHTELPVSLPEVCAPREALLRSLEHAAKRQIVYIKAPGGYGKTVAALLWLRKTGRRAAWYSFDEYDNTSALFYAKFCRMLLSVIPPNQPNSPNSPNNGLMKIVAADAFRDAPVEFTIEILTKADYGKEQVVLVLDDFHAINNAAVIKSFPSILKRLPGNVLVFLLSRNEMPGSFSALQSVGKTTTIGTRELAFSADEIMKHFSGYGRFVTEWEAEAIRTNSDGWIILLNSMFVSSKLHMDTKQFKLSYESFFDNNIWNNFDAEKQRFLMKSALPDRFNVKLCEMLTGVDDCKTYIDALIHGNANISVSGGEYKYHELFRAYLLEKLEESDIDKHELYKKAAQHYLGTNDFMTARRYAVRSEDAALIAESTKGVAGNKKFSLDEYVEFAKISYEEELSEEVCEKLPFLYIPKIFFYFLAGNAAKFEYFMDKLHASIPTLAKKFPPMLENALFISTLDYRIRSSQLLAFYRTMPAPIHYAGIQQSGSVTLNAPFLNRSVRDMYELVDHELHKSLVDDVWRPFAQENIDCFSFCVHGALLLEQNKLNEASQAFSAARNALTERVSHEIGYAVFLGQAETSLLKGNKYAYERHLKEAQEYVEVNKAYYLKWNLWAYEARLGLMDGDKRVAERWLSNYFVNNSGLEVPYKAYQNLTTARAHIVLGDYNAAYGVLHAVKKMAESLNRPLDAAEADVLMSVISWTMGRKKEAADILYNRLLFLCHYGFIRIVANEGKAVLPILTAVANKLGRKPDKDEGMYRFIKEAYLAAYAQSKRFKGITGALKPRVVKLSKQQVLMLELLSKGNKYTEIVDITGAGLNTVRYHIKVIYKKLEVTNMLDAVTKARQLGLLR